MGYIDLDEVKDILEELEELVMELDGQEWDDTGFYADQSKGWRRKERARINGEMMFLATRFRLCAALVEMESWHGKGKSRPIVNPDPWEGPEPE